MSSVFAYGHSRNVNSMIQQTYSHHKLGDGSKQGSNNKKRQVDEWYITAH